jgi:hypothetical protein
MKTIRTFVYGIRMLRRAPFPSTSTNFDVLDRLG